MWHRESISCGASEGELNAEAHRTAADNVPDHLYNALVQPLPSVRRGSSWKPLPVLEALTQDQYSLKCAGQATEVTVKPANDLAVPIPVPARLWKNTDMGLNYALYCLVQVDNSDLDELLHTIKSHADVDMPSWPHNVIRAPSQVYLKTDQFLRGAYDCHVKLVDSGDCSIAPSKFLILPHADWKTQGILLIDLDCHPVRRGTPGIMRANASLVSQCLIVLETKSQKWADLKARELRLTWPAPITGYTDTPWQKDTGEWLKLS